MEKEMSLYKMKKVLGSCWNDSLEEIKPEYRRRVTEIIKKIGPKESGISYQLAKRTKELINAGGFDGYEIFTDSIEKLAEKDQGIATLLIAQPVTLLRNLVELEEENNVKDHKFVKITFKTLAGMGLRGLGLARKARDILKETTYSEKKLELEDGAYYKKIFKSIQKTSQQNFKATINLTKNYSVLLYYLEKVEEEYLPTFFDAIVKAGIRSEEYMLPLAEKIPRIIEEADEPITTDYLLIKSIDDLKAANLINKIADTDKYEKEYQEMVGKFY